MSDAFVSEGVAYKMLPPQLLAVGDGVQVAVSASVDSVSIERDVHHYRVATVSDYAFLNCTGLRAVRLPSSIDSVGAEAFTRTVLP